MRRYHIVCSALTICTLLGVTLAAQQARIINGTVAAQAAGAGLQATIRSLVTAQTEPAWIGYAVPVADRSRVQCCWSNANGTTYISGSMSWSDAPCCGSCRIEPSDGTSAGRPSQTPAPAQGPVKLEGSERMVVMLRVADPADRADPDVLGGLRARRRWAACPLDPGRRSRRQRRVPGVADRDRA